MKHKITWITDRWYRIYLRLVLVPIFFYTSFVSPYMIVFDADPLTTSNPVEIIVELLYFFDLLMQFNLAYLDDNDKVVYKRALIIKRYVMSLNFIFDILGKLNQTKNKLKN